jgi:hypothetical protein
MRQYVVGPLAAQTISGTLTGIIRGLESNAAHNGTVAICVRQVSSTGTHIADLLAVAASDNTAAAPPEFGTTAATRRLQDVAEATTLTLTSRTFSDQDYLVIEIGFRKASTSTSTTVTLRFGDSAATDFAHTDGLTTDLNPWVEFSGTIAPYVPPPGASLFEDDFNRADAATLGGNWTGDAQIISNQAKQNGFGSIYALNSTALGTADYEVEASLNPGALASGGSLGIGLVARYQDVNNFYLLHLDQGGTSMILYEVVGGSYNGLQTNSYTLTNPITVKLSCNGTAIKGYANGVEITSATNSTHTTEGDVGFRAFNPDDTNLTGHRWDNFKVLSFSAGPVYKNLTGTSSGVAATTGVVTRQRKLAGASSGITVTTATLTKKSAYRDLTASATGSTATSGSVRRLRALAGSSAGRTIAVGVVSDERSLVGISVGRTTITALLTRRRALVAAAAGSSVTTGVLSKILGVVGVGWDGAKFEEGVGTPVLWGLDAFQTTGAYPAVIWEDGVFKLA